MTMKFPLRLLAMAAATALALTACGGDSDDDNTAGGGGTAQTVTEAEKTAILNVHNDARAEVGVGKLSWDDTLAANSSDYASKCIWGHSKNTGNTYTYGGNSGDYGENMGRGYTSFAKAAEAWVSEKSSYTPGTVITNENYKTFGHYTQVVWRNTDKVGCGYAACSGGTIYVCQYHKPGNYLGETPY